MDETGIIKVGKKESVLLSWRLIMLLGMFAGTGGIYATRHDTLATREDLADIKQEIINQRREFGVYKDEQGRNRLADTKEFGDLRGRVTGMEGSLDVHRARIKSLEDDMRTFWARLLEIGGAQQPRRGGGVQ